MSEQTEMLLIELIHAIQKLTPAVERIATIAERMMVLDDAALGSSLPNDQPTHGHVTHRGRL